MGCEVLKGIANKNPSECNCHLGLSACRSPRRIWSDRCSLLEWYYQGCLLLLCDGKRLEAVFDVSSCRDMADDVTAQHS